MALPIAGRSYLVTVALLASKCSSVHADPVRFRTAHASGSGLEFTDMFRVSEYSEDVDFLSNHDAGSAGGLVPFLTRWGVWHPGAHGGRTGGMSSIPKGCFAALDANGGQGCRRPGDPMFSGSGCAACVTDRKLPAACVVDGVENSTVKALMVNLYCTRSEDGGGVQWPNFAGLGSPISRYCVERAKVPPTTLPEARAGVGARVEAEAEAGGATTEASLSSPMEGGLGLDKSASETETAPARSRTVNLHDSSRGYAVYASCNAPEALLLNSPTNPVCICWCAFDRMVVSHEAVAQAEVHCGSAVASGKFPPCNCTRPVKRYCMSCSFNCVFGGGGVGPTGIYMKH